METGLHSVVRETLNRHLVEIERKLDCHAMSITGPILYTLETRVRDAIENFQDEDADQSRLAVILETPGGYAEVAERISDTMRAFYDEVIFIIPNMAMSAGTILAMSGDKIMMDYFSRLGPIDPQVLKEGKFVPSNSYLIQYERLIERSAQGELTDAEYVLMQGMDLAELHQFEQAYQLSITLLKRWLACYKFKTWTCTEERGLEVTQDMRQARAEEIATILSDNTIWHSHGRGISREVLESDDIKLQIDHLEDVEQVHTNVRKYHHCLSDYLATAGATPNFVHSRLYM